MPPNQMRPHDKTPLSQNSHSKKAPSDVVQADIKLPHLHPNKSNVAQQQQVHGSQKAHQTLKNNVHH